MGLPLFPQQRTSSAEPSMSEKCHKRKSRDITLEVRRYACRAWLTNGTGAAGLCEGKIAQLVEAKHERKPGLLFTVNSVSRANVISRPQRWPGFQPLN